MTVNKGVKMAEPIIIGKVLSKITRDDLVILAQAVENRALVSHPLCQPAKVINILHKMPAQFNSL